MPEDVVVVAGGSVIEEVEGATGGGPVLLGAVCAKHLAVVEGPLPRLVEVDAVLSSGDEGAVVGAQGQVERAFEGRQGRLVQPAG